MLHTRLRRLPFDFFSRLAEKLKLEGNEAYKSKDYDKAKQFYTQAIGT